MDDIKLRSPYQLACTALLVCKVFAPRDGRMPIIYRYETGRARDQHLTHERLVLSRRA